MTFQSLGIGLSTYTEKNNAGYFEDIKYEVTLKIRTGSSEKGDERVYPIFDGTRITFAPMTSSSMFEKKYVQA